ncbi:MAG: MFS transporter [Ardenticatenaceae bacterium]|nr:MFS transporter [Ardenticatenaceae bacterium]MCB8946479.1 MFS transporter [Ardenticatenaceae bacterium]
MINETQNYKWYILILVVLTNMFIIAIPMMGMSVLAKEISDDLNLTLVQVGIIWGVSALPGIITSLLGGAIGDKIGPKRALVAGALLGGLLGAARGLAGGFLSLTIITLLMGVVLPVVLMNGIKVLGQWFPPQQLGLANGAQAMSMALGFMLGSLLSATTFSPWLGGWRNVLIAYGLIGAALSIPWLFTKVNTAYSADGNSLSIGEAVRHVAGLRNVWLLGLGLFGISGAVQGTLGFLPLYLREVGWEPLQADGALSAFHTVSMIFVLPVALWSDRLRFRKPLLLTAGVMIATGVGLLSFVGGVVVWAAVLLAGSVRDGFMAIFQTMVIESERVGPLYAGTAVGFTMALTSIGNLIAPPIGNSLAAWWPGAPFAFWSLSAVFGLVCLSLVKEKERARENT